MAKPVEKFHPTHHSLRRVKERGLSLEDVKNVVKYPDIRRADSTMPKGAHGGKLYLFKKTIEGKTLAVVAETKLGECWIVTAYFEN